MEGWDSGSGGIGPALGPTETWQDSRASPIQDAALLALHRIGTEVICTVLLHALDEELCSFLLKEVSGLRAQVGSLPVTWR